jgi:hypothetical protein
MDKMLRSTSPANSDAYMSQTDNLRIDQAKITEYLLNSEHPAGSPKARFFASQGFSLDRWEDLRSALRAHAATNKIAKIVNHGYGKKLIVDCFLKSPSGKEYCIRVVWNDHLDGNPPKLITAHPLG